MKIAERSAQMWAVLAWAARHRQNISYPQLAKATGAFTGGLGALLDPIQSYCLTHNLPPLTVLVVQTDSGKPGPGFMGGATATELDSARAKVFAFDWLEHGNPGVEEFSKHAGKSG